MLKRLMELLEEFAGSYKSLTYSSGSMEPSDIEFFKNPKPSEMKIAQKASNHKKCIRFYVDFKKKEVIIWEGGVLHPVALKLLNPNISKAAISKLFCGAANFKSSKMEIMGSDSIEGCWDKKFGSIEVENVLENIKKHKKWLSKYFSNIDEFLRDPRMGASKYF